FGGQFYNSGYIKLNDLWVYNPEHLKWEWLSGSNVVNPFGNYGTLGIPDPGNIPPSRIGALAWWSNENKFYLFGGYSNSYAGLSDMWVFNPDTNCISQCSSGVP